MCKKKRFNIVIRVLLICIAVILIKAEFSSVLLKNATYGIPALINKGAVENLYIGSSMFRQGLDIHTLNEQHPDNYILAYNGNQPSSEYYQLKYLLDHNVQITNLYVDMYVYSAWENPEISDEKIFMEVDMKEKWNLWSLLRPYSDSPLEMFWRIFVNSNNELLLTWPLMYPILNSQFDNGGTLRETVSATYESLSQASVVPLDEGMNPVQYEYINKLINLAQENNINIAFIETPKYEKVSLNQSYINAMGEYSKLLDSKQVSYILSKTTATQLMITTSDSYEFDPLNAKYFMDTIHLSSEGRRIFSEAID